MSSNKFVIALEDFAVKFYTPEDTKKCYSKIIYTGDYFDWKNGIYPNCKIINFDDILLNPKDFVENKFNLYFPDCKLINKSFSWSLCPKGQLPYFKALSIAILCCEKPEGLSLEYFYKKIISKLYDDITEIIRTKDVSKLLEFSVTTKNTDIPELILTFPDLSQNNTTQILWLNKGGKKNPRKYPACKIDEHNLWNKININDLMSNCIGLCKKIIGKKITLKEQRADFIMNNDLDNNCLNIPVRLDHINGK